MLVRCSHIENMDIKYDGEHCRISRPFDEARLIGKK